MRTRYTALIVDLVRSRGYSKECRNMIQHQIMDAVAFLNRLFGGELLRWVDFSAGDEIQGLFSSPEAAYQYYRLFAMLLHPIEIRGGIGVGDWSVQVDQRGTTSQDGPVYHFARHAIEHADDLEGYPVLFLSGGRADRTINTIIGGAASIMAKQTVYQNQIMLMIDLLFPICYEEMHETAAMDQTRELLHRKSAFDHEVEGISKVLPLDRIFGRADELRPYRMEPDRSMQEFYITSGKQRGIPTRLAGIMDVSRQTIEKTIRAGNIYTARNMAIAAISEMRSIG